MTVKNIERLLIKALAADMVGVPVSGDVPAGEDTFITLEQTGYDNKNQIGAYTIAVQCWAPDRFEASELAIMTAGALNALSFSHDFLNVEVSNYYNFPDPERKLGRYQIVCQIQIQQ